MSIAMWAEEAVHGWRKAVANGETTMSLSEWIEQKDSARRYVCAVSKIDVYVYVDLDSGEVCKVVADDNSLPEYEKMQYLYADKDEVVDFASDVPDEAVWRAQAAMKGNVWPAWEWTW